MFVNASYVEYKPSNAIGNDYYSSWCALHDGHYRWNSTSPVDHFPMSSTDMDKLVIKTWADHLPASACPSKSRTLPFNSEAILSYAAHIHDTIVEEEARLCRGSPNREIIPRSITFDWSDMKPPAGAPLRNSVILSPEFSRSSESLPGNWSVEEILGPRGLIGMRWTRVSEHLRGRHGGHWCTTCTGNP